MNRARLIPTCGALLALAAPRALFAQASADPSPPGGPEAATPAERVERPVLDARLIQIVELEGLAAVAIDPKAEDAARLEALGALFPHGQDALPYLLALAIGPDLPVAQATIRQLGRLPPEHAASLAALAVRRAQRPEDRLLVVDVVEELKGREAGLMLWRWAGDEDLDVAVRRAAEAALRRSYPEVLAEKGRANRRADPLAIALTAGGGATTIGVTLAGVGRISDSGPSTVIGGVGGAIIGGSLGGMWAKSGGFTLDQGVALQVGPAWGLTVGALVGSGLAVAPDTTLGWERQQTLNQRRAGLAQMGGVLTGAGVAYLRREAPPSWQDSLALSAAGAMGWVGGVAVDRFTAPACIAPPEADVYAPDGPCAARFAHDARSPLFYAGGTVVGLGAAAALERVWSPTSLADPVLWGVGAGLGSAVGGYAASHQNRVNSVVYTPSGAPALGSAIGFAAGGLTAELLDPALRQSTLSAAGLALGVAGGAGIEQLAGEALSGGPAEALLPAAVGAVGAAAGLGFAQREAWGAGDRTLVAVGTPMVWGWSALYEASFAGAAPVDGLALTSGAALNGGLLALSRYVEPEAGDMALLGAGAGWGATLGVMVPLALDAQRGDRVALVTALSSQAATGITAAALFSSVALEPARTLRPQLGGVAGLTTGSLIAGLVAPEGPVIATGGLIGTAAGFVGGAVWERARGGGQASALPSPGGPRLPRGPRWAQGAQPSFSASPALIGDELGVSVRAGLWGW